MSGQLHASAAQYLVIHLIEGWTGRAGEEENFIKSVRGNKFQ
jgi:hypothetical protein